MDVQIATIFRSYRVGKMDGLTNDQADSEPILCTAYLKLVCACSPDLNGHIRSPVGSFT